MDSREFDQDTAEYIQQISSILRANTAKEALERYLNEDDAILGSNLGRLSYGAPIEPIADILTGVVAERLPITETSFTELARRAEYAGDPGHNWFGLKWAVRNTFAGAESWWENGLPRLLRTGTRIAQGEENPWEAWKQSGGGYLGQAARAKAQGEDFTMGQGFFPAPRNPADVPGYKEHWERSIQQGMLPHEAEQRANEWVNGNFPTDIVGKTWAAAENTQLYKTRGATTYASPVSLGRLLGIQVSDPGTVPFNLMSSIIDGYTRIGMDPIDVGFDEWRLWRQGRNRIMPAVGQEAGLRQSWRPWLKPQDVEDWFARREGRNVVDFLTRNTSFNETDKLLRPMSEGDKLRINASSDPNEIRNILRRNFGAIETVEDAPRLNRRQHIFGATLPIDERKGVRGAMSHVRNESAIGRSMHRWLAQTGYTVLDPTDANQTIEAARNWMETAMMGRDDIDRVLVDLAENAGDYYGMQTGWNKMLDGFESRVGALGYTPFEEGYIMRQVMDNQFQATNYFDNVAGEDVIELNSKFWDDTRGNRHFVPSGHAEAEFQHRVIYMPTVREVRRATSRWRAFNQKWRRAFPGEGTKGLPKHFQNPLGIEPWALARALDPAAALWRNFALMRIGWPLRVIPEELLRQGAAGYNDIVRHPLSYLSLAFTDLPMAGIADESLDSMFAAKNLGSGGFSRNLENDVIDTRFSGAGRSFATIRRNNEVVNKLADVNIDQLSRGEQHIVRTFSQGLAREFTDLYMSDTPRLVAEHGIDHTMEYLQSPEGLKIVKANAAAADPGTPWRQIWDGQSIDRHALRAKLQSVEARIRANIGGQFFYRVPDNEGNFYSRRWKDQNDQVIDELGHKQQVEYLEANAGDDMYWFPVDDRAQGRYELRDLIWSGKLQTGGPPDYGPIPQRGVGGRFYPDQSNAQNFDVWLESQGYTYERVRGRDVITKPDGSRVPVSELTDLRARHRRTVVDQINDPRVVEEEILDLTQNMQAQHGKIQDHEAMQLENPEYADFIEHTGAVEGAGLQLEGDDEYLAMLIDRLNELSENPVSDIRLSEIKRNVFAAAANPNTTQGKFLDQLSEILPQTFDPPISERHLWPEMGVSDREAFEEFIVGYDPAGGWQREVAKVPADNLDGRLKSVYDNVTNNVFAFLMEVPTQKLVRQPFVALEYNRQLARMYLWADDPTRTKLRAWARSKGMINPFDDAVQENLKLHGLKDLPDISTEVLPDGQSAAFNYEEASAIAKYTAAEKTRELFYDLQKRGNWADMTRLIFPFADAWWEVLSRWAKFLDPTGIVPGQALGSTPQSWRNIRRLGVGMTAGRRVGFFDEDQYGNEVFNFPALGAMGLPSSPLGDVEGARLRGQASMEALLFIDPTARGFMAPGGGPWSQIAAKMVAPRLPKPLADAANWVAFGEFTPPRFESAGDIVEMFLPTYGRRFSEMLGVFANGQADEVYADDIMLMATAASLSPDNRFGSATPDQARFTQEMARTAGSNLSILRVFESFYTPAQPQYLQEALLDIRGLDGEMQELFFDVAALSREWNEALEIFGDDELAAAQWWLRTYGFDPLNLTSQSRFIKDRPTTESENIFREEHPDLEIFDNTMMMWVPDYEDLEDIDYGVFRKQFDADEKARENLTAGMMLQLTNSRAAWKKVENLRETRDVAYEDCEGRFAKGSSSRVACREGVRSWYNGEMNKVTAHDGPYWAWGRKDEGGVKRPSLGTQMEEILAAATPGTDSYGAARRLNPELHGFVLQVKDVWDEVEAYGQAKGNQSDWWLTASSDEAQVVRDWFAKTVSYYAEELERTAQPATTDGITWMTKNVLTPLLEGWEWDDQVWFMPEDPPAPVPDRSDRQAEYETIDGPFIDEGPS